MVDVEKELEMLKMSLFPSSGELVKKAVSLLREVAVERDRAVDLAISVRFDKGGMSFPEAESWVLLKMRSKP